MGSYLEPIAAAQGNVTVSADGSIYLTYLLRGTQVSPSNIESLQIAQREHEALLNAIPTMPGIDQAYVGAFKALVSREERLQSIIAGLGRLTNENNPILRKRIEFIDNWLTYSGHQECRRVYVLCVRLAGTFSGAAAALRKAGAVGAPRGTDWDGLDRAQKQIRQEIPDSFRSLPTGPEHLIWLHERMRLRGLDVPKIPAPQAGFSPTGFADVEIDKAGDSEALFSKFVDLARSGNLHARKATKEPKGGSGGWLRQWTANYRPLVSSTSLLVYSPDRSSDAAPNGPAARQTLIAVAGYPKKAQTLINGFTFLADKTVGLDIDWAMRFEFDQTDISVEQHRAFEKSAQSETDGNVTDRHDAQIYADKRRERDALGQQAYREGSTARAVAVTTIFAVADPDAQKLEKGVRAFRQKLERHGFTTFVPVGGQFDLLKQMMPCVPHSALTKDLMGVTTVRKLAACFPVRRTEIGDAVGVPIAINRETSLGQIVLMDFLGSTDKGSGSLAVTGAQGAGKSYFLKMCIDWLAALKRPTTIFDQSESREYMSFARSLGHVQTIVAANPAVSLDPLKVFAPVEGDSREEAEAKMERAKTVFLEAAQMLFDCEVDAPKMLLLSQILSPATRRAYRIHSSRDILSLLYTGSFAEDKAAEDLQNSLRYWAGQTYAKALFDPVDQAQRVQPLPAYRRSSDADSVVFVTHGLPIVEGKPSTPLERYSVVLHTVMAWVTVDDHARIPGLCALVADEVSFWDGSSVLKQLLGEPDKTGRKEQNIVLVGGQLGKHFRDSAYDLVRKWLVLRQETAANARDAFERADFPATTEMVRQLVTNTSPVDPEDNNRPMVGREGEGYFNDGFGGRARVKLLEIANSKGRILGDTTASRMVRERDLARTAHRTPERVG